MASHTTSHDQSTNGTGTLDTFVILFGVALFAYVAGLFVPAGFFVTPEGAALAPGQYQVAGQADLMPVFGAGETIGFLNFLFEGLVSGNRNGATVGLMAFILIVGGSFGMIMRTGAIELALERAVARRSGKGHMLVPGLFILFSLCGAIFGMSEEAIVFALIVVPAMVRMGYDSITGLLVTYVATQIGFATSWMNPFGVVIAQGIADVPALSGMEFRLAMWCLFTAFGATFAYFHGRRVAETPMLSKAHASDAAFRKQGEGVQTAGTSFGWRQAVLLGLLALGVGWVIWGVLSEGYYLPEIATQFFAIGLACAIFALLTNAAPVDANGYAAAFKDGAMQLAPAAIVVGIAKGVVILLGGDDPSSPSVLNTVLFHMSQATAGLADWAAAWIMYLLQSGLNFLVVSGSGQAALTMPLMTPLADLSGVSRQTAVLAFQLGDGLTNIICPASAALMGCLGAAKLDWLVWAKFILKFQLYLTALASLMMVLAVLTGYQ